LAGALNLADELFDIVIGSYDFALLCTVTQETLSLGVDEVTKKRIKKYFNECHKLNQTARLIVAHGTWTLEGGARHVSRSISKPSITSQRSKSWTNKLSRRKSFSETCSR
jgi:hypothetical protein